jgi:16S rRNA (uracil1498-N3)-methyltransferase
MDYFYVPPERIEAGYVVIDGEELAHLAHVMRKKEGDEIMVVDGEGNAFDVLLSTVTKRSARGIIRKSYAKYHEPAIHVTLAVGILKNPSKFDFLVEKATEVGVTEIIPLRTDRTIPSRAKSPRWQKLALSAMKQCGRSCLPRVKNLTGFDDVLRAGAGYGRKLIAHPESVRAGSPGLSPPAAERTLILVGPEGGFTEDEIARALGAGFEPVFLGERRLRTETAAVALAALIILR